MSGHNRLWIIAYLATCLFLVASVEGKSLRHSSRESSQIPSKKQTTLQRIRPHRQVQEEEEQASQLENNTTTSDDDDDEDEEYILHQAANTTARAGDAEEAHILQLETNTTATEEQEEYVLQVGITTKAGETGSSPFFFGNGDTGDENPSPFNFGPQQADDGGPQVEAEGIPSVNLNVTTPTEEEAGPYSTNLDAQQQPTNDTTPSSAQFNSEQPRQPEYTNFHFGAGEMHQQENSANHMIREESHQQDGHYVDGELVDQFADMFNMVHVSSGHYPPPYSGSSSKGKGSIYIDEFDVHGKGGKGKGGKSKGNGGVGKGAVPHASGSSGPSDGSARGPSGKYKMSKKSSSSGSKAYRREHRLTMPPMETNSHGASSEKSRR